MPVPETRLHILYLIQEWTVIPTVVYRVSSCLLCVSTWIKIQTLWINGDVSKWETSLSEQIIVKIKTCLCVCVCVCAYMLVGVSRKTAVQLVYECSCGFKTKQSVASGHECRVLVKSDVSSWPHGCIIESFYASFLCCVFMCLFYEAVLAFWQWVKKRVRLRFYMFTRPRCANFMLTYSCTRGRCAQTDVGRKTK